MVKSIPKLPITLKQNRQSKKIYCPLCLPDTYMYLSACFVTMTIIFTFSITIESTRNFKQKSQVQTKNLEIDVYINAQHAYT